ncbi:MAG: hypothetical protein JO165_01870 [Candidatus Eremiobacteraeota bacterium]|nr:hypothetical protein [Candidatus Eremiobacteraeota bacterium]
MSVPAIVERAAQVAAGDHRGIVSFEIEQHTQIDGGPIHRTAHAVIIAAYDDEQLIRVKVLRLEENGKDASAERIRYVERELTAHSEGFAVPFDRNHFNEYAYTVDGNTVRFTSKLQDARHGEGTFEVAADGHVTHLHYTPHAFPQFATAGTVDEDRAPVLPAFWATVRSEQHYTGRYFLIRGTADIVTTESHFARYASRAEALAALGQ